MHKEIDKIVNYWFVYEWLDLKVKILVFAGIEKPGLYLGIDVPPNDILLAAKQLRWTGMVLEIWLDGWEIDTNELGWKVIMCDKEIKVIE